MDIKQLTAFVTVAELGSVTRAANSLHLTQSAVTRQIQGLEHELGVILFERTRAGMTLTAEGRIMADHSRSALVELGRARAEIAPTPSTSGEIVTVGLLESIADAIGVPLTAALHREFPELDLRMVISDSGHLRDRMGAADLDLSLTAETVGAPAAHTTPLATEQLWTIAPAAARLRPGVPIALVDVLHNPMVLPPVGSALRDLLDSVVGSIGAEFRVAATTAAVHMQKRLVATERCWAILPPIAFTEDLAAQTISAAPLHSPHLQRRIVLTRTPPEHSTRAIENVARLTVHLVRTEIRDGRWPTARPIGYRGDDSRLCG
ncbi:LysR family transcriptional regulator [Nocardia jiangxiensis]|uniref:LysR family transcriptional regulator n=1 Tax=Nocardia jiangxiensis TaxID=282685 RepID=UPI0003016A66|nr:LysR family transcriptional regulator [Nocardia jiangxiensis]